MHRRQLLVGCGCLTLCLAGCLDDESEDSGSYFAVARPYETVPPDGPTTSHDEPAVGELLAEIAIEALETNSTVSRRLDADEREETVDRIDTLPRYEGNDEFESAVYITYSEQAAAVFSERHL